MKHYTLEEVTTPRQMREFLDMANKIYRGNKNWVRPLDTDIESRFDPKKNELLAEGEIIAWIARDSSGDVVGRIAAFHNKETAVKDNEQPTGGCGFFESIDDQELANMLFDAAQNWLRTKGMEAMDGPINFGNRDQWWGLLVEGFDYQPLYANPYNPPYYKDLFENYGFQLYFNQHTYLRRISEGDLNPTVYERVKRLQETPGFRFAPMKGISLEQVTENFRLIYNKAWAQFTGVKPLGKEEASEIMHTLRPIIDKYLIYFAYFNEEPVGFFIMVPDLNRIIAPFNGKFNLWNKIRLLYNLKFTKKADRIFAMIFGVTPEFHGKGIEAGIMHCFEQHLSKVGKYKSLELAWIGDFNPVMMRMVENYVCAQKFKRHVTYRYLFDRTKEFKRMPRMTIQREK